MPIKQKAWLESTDAFISLQSGMALLNDLLMEFGELPDVFLRKTRLFQNDFLSLERRVSAEQMAQLCYNATLTDHSSDLAFQLGQRLLPSALQTWSQGMQHAPTLNDAFYLLMNSTSHWSPLIAVECRQTEERLYFVFRDAFGLLQDSIHKQFVMTYSMEAFRYACDWLLPIGTVIDWQFELEGVPENLEEYSGIWGKEIGVGVKRYSVSISNQFAQSALKMPSQGLYQTVLAEVMSNETSSIVEEVRTYLAQDVRCIPSLDALCEHVGMSLATLKRKLKKHNTNYQMLVDQIREDEGHFLHDRMLYTEADLVEHFSFYDVSNFRRARKRWRWALHVSK
ncbi:AraC family transcriptional regulator ligand-binding domain-containing protein [Marinomonas balearica]|uniref:AraC-like DNA-binding protein n=1 Tax=Marinomonas balearica TaxID=491947 RepID=A0A4R6MJE1_9GAMM|nr:AraC family transcriptional regulator ligand-binding domain-containing protein [Marinomonas balearica]TDP01914.1 AraC-like DNA-binding protein [Marinomonas balearica]